MMNAKHSRVMQKEMIVYKEKEKADPQFRA